MFSGCRPAKAPPPQPDVRAVDDGLRVEFPAPTALEFVRISDRGGRPLQEFRLAGVHRVQEVPFRWSPATEYRVALRWSGTQMTKTVRSPAAGGLRGSVEAPLGQDAIVLGSAPESAVLVPTDGSLAIALLTESRRQAARHFRWQIDLPKTAVLTSDDSRLTGAGGHWEMTGKSELEFDYAQAIARVQLRRDAREARIHLRFQQAAVGSAWGPPLQLELRLQSMTSAELKSLVSVEDVIFPADAIGLRRPEQLADAVVLPNPVWSAVRRLFRRPGVLFNEYEPYAQQAVVVRNRAHAPLNLLIESEVAGRSEGEALAEFAPPLWYSPQASATARHIVRVPGRGTATAVLPVFVRGEALPGTYVRQFRLSLVGGSTPLLELTRPLAVLRGDTTVSAVVLAALALALASWFWAAVAGRACVKAIGAEGLAMIALVASLHFCVSYVSRIAGNALGMLIGPFNIFAEGLASEGLACLLLAVAVTLIPKPGALAISNLAVFLLNALFTGQFGLVELLFVTVSAALGEICLAAAGVTTGRSFRKPAAKVSALAVCQIAAAIGLANAGTLYAQFCLSQVLFRLFYSAWYVAAVALLTGLVYGAAGAALGALLGGELRRTLP